MVALALSTYTFQLLLGTPLKTYLDIAVTVRGLLKAEQATCELQLLDLLKGE